VTRLNEFRAKRSKPPLQWAESSHTDDFHLSVVFLITTRVTYVGDDDFVCERAIVDPAFHSVNAVLLSAAHVDMLIVQAVDGMDTVRAWSVHTGQLIYGPSERQPKMYSISRIHVYQCVQSVKFHIQLSIVRRTIWTCSVVHDIYFFA
jgi:hypothetical protein